MRVTYGCENLPPSAAPLYHRYAPLLPSKSICRFTIVLLGFLASWSSAIYCFCLRLEYILGIISPLFALFHTNLGIHSHAKWCIFFPLCCVPSKGFRNDGVIRVWTIGLRTCIGRRGQGNGMDVNYLQLAGSGAIFSHLYWNFFQILYTLGCVVLFSILRPVYGL